MRAGGETKTGVHWPHQSNMENFAAAAQEGAILVVEDNEDDVFLMKRMLKAAGVVPSVVVAENGHAAMEYLANEEHPLPVVVFLDLKMPLVSGHEVLAWIRKQPRLEGLVVVVVTSSDEPSDVRRSYSLGANSYLMKPLTVGQLTDLAKAFNWSWLRGTESLAAEPKAS
jgi:CheY-like chemotaxis protein